MDLGNSHEKFIDSVNMDPDFILGTHPGWDTSLLHGTRHTKQFIEEE